MKEIQFKLDLNKRAEEEGINNIDELGDFLAIDDDDIGYKVNTFSPHGGASGASEIDLPTSGRGSKIDSKRNSYAHLYNSNESPMKSPLPEGAAKSIDELSEIDEQN